MAAPCAEAGPIRCEVTAPVVLGVSGAAGRVASEPIPSAEGALTRSARARSSSSTSVASAPPAFHEVPSTARGGGSREPSDRVRELAQADNAPATGLFADSASVFPPGRAAI